MKQHLLLTTLLILGLGTMVHAQNTGIGTITPDPDAALEVSATDKGLLLPRIALTGTAAAAPLSGHKEGMTVYNTATAADVTPGYYYNDGTQWVRIAEADADINTLLSLDPVTGVLTYTNENNDNPTVDLTAIEPWFGTDNNAGATDNTEDIYTLGRVGVGVNTLDTNAEMEINGDLKFTHPLNSGISNSIVGGEQIVRFGQNMLNTQFGYGDATKTNGGYISFDSRNNSNAIYLAVKDDTAPNQERIALAIDAPSGNIALGSVVAGVAPTEQLDVYGKVRVRDLTGADLATDVIVTADATTGVLKEGGTVADLVNNAETNTTLALNNPTGVLTYTNEDNDNPPVDLTAIEPWFGTDNNAGATENTEDIYTLGNVGIGTNNPQETFHVDVTSTDLDPTSFSALIQNDNANSRTLALLTSDVAGLAISSNGSANPNPNLLNNAGTLSSSHDLILMSGGRVGNGATTEADIIFLTNGFNLNEEKMRIGADGQITFNQYTGTNFDEANPNYILSTNGTTGDITKTSIADLASASQINTTLALDNPTGVLTYNNEDNDNPTVDLTAIEPWFGTDNNAGATENTEDIYTEGRVGIGVNTLDPNAELEINGDLKFTGNLNSGASNIIIGADEVLRIGQNMPFTSFGVGDVARRDGSYISFDSRDAFAAFYIDIKNGASLKTALSINSPSGNVALGAPSGVTNTTEQLDVYGKVRIRDLTEADLATDVIVTADATTGVLKEGGTLASITAAAADGDAWGVTGEDQTSTIGRTGNVGIGTTTPAAVKLEVVGANNQIRLRGLSSTISNSAFLDFRDGDNNRIGYIGDGALFENALHIYSDTDDIRLAAGDILNPNIYLVNDASRNVGIGTTTPTAKTHIAHNVPSSTSLLVEGFTGNSNASVLVDLKQNVQGAGENDIVLRLEDINTAGLIPNGYLMKAFGDHASLGTGTSLDEIFAIRTDGQVRVGVDQLLVNPANGNVGIGTSTPNERLEVNGKVRVSDLTGADLATDVIVTADATTGELKEGGTLASISAAAADGDAWGVTGENVASAIGRTGNVGIGITTPTSPLHIFKDVPVQMILERSSAQDSYINYKNTGLDWTAGLDASLGFVIAEGPAITTNPRFLVEAGGNVGIGTTTPTAKTHILESNSLSTNTVLLVDKSSGNGNVAVAAHIRTNLDNGGENDMVLQLEHTNTAGGTPTGYLMKAFGDHPLTGTATSLDEVFAIRADGQLRVGTDQLVVNPANGNVGIGNANPLAPLTVGDINSNIALRNKYAFGTNSSKTNTTLIRAGALLQTSDADPFVLYTSVRGGATDNARTALLQTGSNNNNLGNLTLQVIPGSNVGIGTYLPSEKLHVIGNIRASGNLQSGTTTYPDYVFENYVDGSNSINKSYEFKTLKEVNAFIKLNKHLPGVTGIKDLQKTDTGYNVDITALSVQTLEKVEELFIHTIEQQHKIDAQEQKINAQQKIINQLLKRVEALEKQ